MIRRLAIPAALALTLGACATYNSGYADRSGRDGYYSSDTYASGDGYYAAGHDGYGDYYYDNPQLIVDQHYGSYGGGYYDYGYPSYGFGYGGGYFPYNGFALQFGFGPGWYGGYPYGYYAPWYGYRHHHHRRGNDGDNDADDRRGTGSAGLIAPTSGMRVQPSLVNRQSNPGMQRPGGGMRTGDRPPSRPPDAERTEPRLEQGRYSNAPASREQLPRRRRDDDGDGR